MLSPEELAEHPDNIEGLEGLDPSWDIDYDDLEFHGELARGNFGAVSVADYLGTRVAVKRLFDLDDDMKIYLQRELNVLKQIRHPNIVQFLGLSKTHEGLYLITEFVERGDLCRLLYDPAIKELDLWSLRLKVSVEAAQGLAYIHAKNLIHRDIKAANYLTGENWHIKLCDFGFSRSVNGKPGLGGPAAAQAGSQMTLCGTDEWMAPETMMGLDYNQAADVFSFGMFLTEVIFRAEPEQRSAATGFRFDVVKYKKQLSRVTCPPAMEQLVLDATTYDADSRPRIKKVLQRLQELSKTYVDPEPVTEVAEPPVAPIVASRTQKTKAAPAANSNGDDDKHRLTKSKKKHKDRGASKERPAKKEKKRDDKRDDKKEKKVDKKETSEKKKERKRTTGS